VKALGDLLGGAIAAAAAGAADDDGEALRKRQTDAREVRDRLPPFVRACTAAELASRIGSPALLHAVKVWNWGDGNLLLAGPTRVGKSTAAAYLFKRLLSGAVRSGGEAWERARWMRWVSVEDLSVARRGQRLGQGEPPEAIEACNARLLVLDDCGWDKDITEVCSVLAARYERGLPTVITTGLSRGELVTHYGAAVVRRMLEAGGKSPVLVECFQKG
jgi:DNA replication protein DnaC